MSVNLHNAKYRLSDPKVCELLDMPALQSTCAPHTKCVREVMVAHSVGDPPLSGLQRELLQPPWGCMHRPAHSRVNIQATTPADQ